MATEMLVRPAAEQQARRIIPIEEMRQAMGFSERREWYERPAHIRKLLTTPGMMRHKIKIHRHGQWGEAECAS